MAHVVLREREQNRLGHARGVDHVAQTRQATQEEGGRCGVLVGKDTFQTHVEITGGLDRVRGLRANFCQHAEGVLLSIRRPGPRR